LDEEKKKRIIEILKGQPGIYERILKFQKLDIFEFKNILFSKDLIVELDLLKEFLSQQGILY
jgi:hypothetical protein